MSTPRAKAPFKLYAQPRLGRVVLDVKAPYWTVPVRDYFLNSNRFATGQVPSVPGWRDFCSGSLNLPGEREAMTTMSEALPAVDVRVGRLDQ